MKPAPKKNGRPINEERREMEASLGVSARRVQQLVQELGLDKISDMSELRLREKRVVIALRGLQARREEHDLTLAKRIVIPASEVQELGFKLGSAIEKLFHDLLEFGPAQLAGKTEIEVYEILKSIFLEALTEHREQVAKL